MIGSDSLLFGTRIGVVFTAVALGTAFLVRNDLVER
jgi:hypothetical protein